MLPPLHQLSIGAPTVTEKRDRSEEEDNAAKKVRGLARGPCEGGGEGGALCHYTITQEQAAEWYRKGTYLGAGNFGETHSYKVPEDELPGGPWVAIKRFERPHVQSGKIEMERHLQIWHALEEHKGCREYLSVPASMTTEWVAASQSAFFTVQTLVHGYGLPLSTRTEAFDAVVVAFAKNMRMLAPEKKREIAHQYGDMMGCFTKAKMLHNDLHGANVLVTHNLNDKFKSKADMSSRLYFRFHTIDWGLSIPLSPSAYDNRGVPRTVCLHNDPKSKFELGNPENSIKDKLQRDWRLMFGIQGYDTYPNNPTRCIGEFWHGVYLLLVMLFLPITYEEELSRDGVTRAQLLDWVRIAYLERLGAQYPPEERAAMDKLIEEELTKPKSERTLKLPPAPDPL
jgi:hypothetical protein